MAADLGIIRRCICNVNSRFAFQTLDTHSLTSFEMLKLFLFLHTCASVVLSAVLPASIEKRDSEPKQIWRPQAGLKFQIILDAHFRRSRNAELLPSDADIFDIDLFDSAPELIQKLHRQGKKVICYMNAGSSETWRPDYASIKATDKGDVMKEWRTEQWLDIRSPDVFEVMRKRIQMASVKVCSTSRESP